MRLYLCFWRAGETENPQKDIVFATHSRERYDAWFSVTERGDKEFRAYGHEITYRDRLMNIGQVPDFIYRGGPGV